MLLFFSYVFFLFFPIFLKILLQICDLLHYTGLATYARVLIYICDLLA